MKDTPPQLLVDEEWIDKGDVEDEQGWICGEDPSPYDEDDEG